MGSNPRSNPIITSKTPEVIYLTIDFADLLKGELKILNGAKLSHNNHKVWFNTWDN